MITSHISTSVIHHSSCSKNNRNVSVLNTDIWYRPNIPPPPLSFVTSQVLITWSYRENAPRNETSSSVERRRVPWGEHDHFVFVASDVDLTNHHKMLIKVTAVASIAVGLVCVCFQVRNQWEFTWRNHPFYQQFHSTGGQLFWDTSGRRLRIGRHLGRPFNDYNSCHVSPSQVYLNIIQNFIVLINKLMVIGRKWKSCCSAVFPFWAVS